ncbi:MAG: hypothetical protein EOO06_03320 [Chitinophagaceae bacterium]|nr:MAG: hypothetical protein EOO06_03320 [Chitinophagaceae bacterium]
MSEPTNFRFIQAFLVDRHDAISRRTYQDGLPAYIQPFLTELYTLLTDPEKKANDLNDLVRSYGFDIPGDELWQWTESFYTYAAEHPESEDAQLLQANAHPVYRLLADDALFAGYVDQALLQEERNELREELAAMSIFPETSKVNFSKMTNARMVVAPEKRKEQAISGAAARGKVRRLYHVLLPAVAACLLIMLVWQPFFTSDEKLFTQFATPEQVTPPTYGFTDPDATVRGKNAQAIRGLNANESKLVSSGYELLMQKRPEEAWSKFRAAGISLEKGPSYLLYRAMSELYTGRIDAARTHFKECINAGGMNAADAQYYLALLELKQGNHRVARKLLKEISNGNNHRKENASAILRKMRWF